MDETNQGAASGLVGPYRNRRADVEVIPKGRITKTVLGESMARLLVEDRFDELACRFLNSKDERVALDAFKFLFEHAYGKPRNRTGDDSADKIVEIKFDIGRRESGDRSTAASNTGENARIHEAPDVSGPDDPS